MTPIESTPVESRLDRHPPAEAATRPGSRADRVFYWLAFGAAASVLVSIAVSQILLGASLLWLVSGLVVTRRKLRFPPIALPLALFFSCTIVADLLSGDALRGMPQIRKFFVFGIIPVVFAAFRSVRQIRNLVLTWAGLAALSAGAAIAQFIHRWREAVELKAPLYDYVLDGRITGFASHWMTYGGEQMIALLMLASLLLFAPGIEWKIFGWTLAAAVWIAIVIGLTRSIFLAGVPAGVVVLAWNYRRWLVFAAPVAVAAIFLAAPAQIRDRAFSVFRPHGDVDSNSRRLIMARTGLRMIESHPLFGVGPEQVQPQFLQHLPPDVPLPLPKGWYGHLHNVYLQYAAERGLPALACVLWMFGTMVRDFLDALRKSREHPEARFVWLGALAVVAAILAEGFFEYNLGDSEVLTMFLATMTCGYVAMGRERQA
jgi:putative inorganic carbon (HCO3(-)) transporter